MAEAQQPKFDARLKEGIAYFEEMLRVMPDDRTTLEFLSVAYPQLGEDEKAENALASLARVLLKEGDLESASALLPRLETCAKPEAKAMALKIRAASAPRPDLSPETAPKAGGGAPGGSVAAACASEAALAEDLGDATIAEHIRKLSGVEGAMLVSTLATLAHEHPETSEKAIARLADKYGMPPVPLEAFDPDPTLVAKLPEEIVRVRGVVPFAKIGAVTLVAFLSPQDAALRRAIASALGGPGNVRFFLADPLSVEKILSRLFPEEEPAER